jgi:hypothetical protein
MAFQKISPGITGQNLIDSFNGNVDYNEEQLNNLAAAILLRLLSNNVKQIKVENSKMYYTLDDSTWYTVDNNVWGSITGTITDQADLKTALSGKASTDDIAAVNTSIKTLNTTVSGLSTTVGSQGTTITQNTKSIGDLQTNIADKVSSPTIKKFRISASGFLEYTVDNVTWKVVQSLSDVTWGSISGEISNQVDLNTILASKVNTSTLNDHTNNKSNPHEVTKAQVGLSEVDNTSDANKPISTAVAAALEIINTSISHLTSGKLDKSTDIQEIKYVTLEQYNTLKDNNQLVDTTIYVVS